VKKEDTLLEQKEIVVRGNTIGLTRIKIMWKIKAVSF